jgi:hypothetical protein
VLVKAAEETANKLYVNNLKYDAQALAKTLHMNNLKRDGQEQAELLFIEEIKDEAREEARKINHERLREMAAKEAEAIIAKSKESQYVVTDVNSRYLRVNADSKKIKLGGNRFGTFSANAKTKYNNSTHNSDIDILVSLKDQLSELGLGNDTAEENKMRLAA